MNLVVGLEVKQGSCPETKCYDIPWLYRDFHLLLSRALEGFSPTGCQCTAEGLSAELRSGKTALIKKLIYDLSPNTFVLIWCDFMLHVRLCERTEREGAVA